MLICPAAPSGVLARDLGERCGGGEDATGERERGKKIAGRF